MEKFELTQEFIDRLHEAVKGEDDIFITEEVCNLHPADIAEIIDRLRSEDSFYVFDNLDKELAADVLVELDEDVRDKLLKSVPSEKIASYFVDNVESDDAADILNDLPEETKKEILSHILLEDTEQATDIADLLDYEEDSAGGLMAKELVSVQLSWTSEQCIYEIRKQSPDIEKIFAVYVVDENNMLKGRLSLKQLIIQETSRPISEIYSKNIVSVTATTKGEEVAHLMQKYDMIVMPVIDTVGRLLGRITIDDVVDFIVEEAEKDYQLVSGLTDDIEHDDSIWENTRARLPWLFIGMVGGVIGAKCIGVFEEQIRNNPEMAFFVPLIAAMGGNAGVQSSSIIVQGIANQSIKKGSIISKLFKEFKVSFINALICSLVILVYNYIFYDNSNLAVTVSVSLFTVIVFASIFGTLVPLVLNKYKVDPAIATGPFITTVNDILGIILYFFLGQVLYTLLSVG